MSMRRSVSMHCGGRPINDKNMDPVEATQQFQDAGSRETMQLDNTRKCLLPS